MRSQLQTLRVIGRCLAATVYQELVHKNKIPRLIKAHAQPEFTSCTGVLDGATNLQQPSFVGEGYSSWHWGLKSLLAFCFDCDVVLAVLKKGAGPKAEVLTV